MARSPSSPKGLDVRVKGVIFEARSPESPVERKSRLRREEADDELQRFVKRAAVRVAATISIFCAVVVALPWTPPETSKRAQMILATMVGGAIVHMRGSSSRDP
jgi:hypothetical protein